MKVGDRMIYAGDHAPLYGKPCVVVAVLDPKTSPGKHIAIGFKDPYVGGHDCDGLLPAAAPLDGKRRGHGRWSIPDRLMEPTRFDAMLEQHRQLEEKQTEAHDAFADFVIE